MPKSFMELSNERKLVLLCSRGNLSQDHKEQIIKILNGWVDWKEVVYQGVTHRTLNLIYYHIKQLGYISKVEKEVLKLMENESKVYALRNKTSFAEIQTVFEELNRQNIRVAILKGNYLAANVYPSIETRTFNDIDFLIDVKDSSKIVNILNELGYIQGECIDDIKIVQYNRKQNMHHQMTTHELAPCFKKTDNPFHPVVQIDLNYSILWKGNCPCEINTAELLERAIQVDINGAKVYRLANEDFLIQLACHLYKEATILSWVTNLRDLQIYKFTDIAIFVERNFEFIKWEDLVEFCKRTKCEKIVYYSFYYVNMMFGDIIPNGVMQELKPDDLTYLDEYGIENEKPSKWDSDFFTRLFETNRILQLTDEELYKRNNFYSVKESLGN